MWLGRGNHAILTGRFDEAAQWLDRCLTRRPEDQSVWKAKRALAQATDDAASVWEAVAHLSETRFEAAEVSSLRAWLAARAGDRSAERQELTNLLRIDPSDSQATERLAVLTFQAGLDREAHQLRRRKAEMDRAQDAFRAIILAESPPIEQAGDLARLARTLGRTFDAQGWSILHEGHARTDHQGQEISTPMPPDLIPKAVAPVLAVCERHGRGATDKGRAACRSASRSPRKRAKNRTLHQRLGITTPRYDQSFASSTTPSRPACISALIMAAHRST